MKIRLNDYNKSDIIKIIREWSNLTQEEFGKTINRSKKTIRDYEAGRINYNIDTLIKIIEEHNLIVTIEKKK